MNQTKKRLNIINLAISITDIETIQIQISRLSILKSDEKLQEILTQLEAKNYARSQKLITTYIETPTNNMKQKIEDKIEEIQNKKDQEIIEEFGLFLKEPEDKEETQKRETLEKTERIEEISDIASFIDPLPEAKKISTETNNYDALLNMMADDILPNNIDLESHKKITEEAYDKKEISNESDINPDDNEIEVMEDSSYYKPVSDIEETLSEIYEQYPLKEMSKESFPSVDAWLLKISNEKHSEEEIEDMLQYIDELREKNAIEAAKLLLVTSATESKYAQFRLARELYRGELFEKSIDHSFAMIASLAIHDEYPEAICDLAQFYENGIGTDQDMHRAQDLYKKAMNLGIQRAAGHYERITK